MTTYLGELYNFKEHSLFFCINEKHLLVSIDYLICITTAKFWFSYVITLVKKMYKEKIFKNFNFLYTLSFK